MNPEPSTLCKTERLVVRPAEPRDVDGLFELWTDPRVMTFVGFPRGLPTSPERILRQIECQGDSEFGQVLVVECRATRAWLGQCGMQAPDPDGIVRTDIKLLPAHWGNKYGIELKRALLTRAFNNPDCRIVEATPNIENIASIKMQEAVGAVRIREDIHEFPESMRGYTEPVHHYVYHVARNDAPG